MSEHGAAFIDAVRALWAASSATATRPSWKAPRAASGPRRSTRCSRWSPTSSRRARTSGRRRFLADLAARAGAERAGAVSGVNLLTYHRAKGLEWDAVFLPMLEEGSLPISHALNDPAALEEERRLLYVGMTRARIHLALSWAESRANPNGSTGRKRPSRFLEAILPKGVPRCRPKRGSGRGRRARHSCRR